MGILAKCPACGMVSGEIRCPRCNALKVVGCSGSCALCKSDCETVECEPAPGAARGVPGKASPSVDSES